MIRNSHVWPCANCLSVCLLACLSVCLSRYLYACLSVHPPACLPNLSVKSSVCFSICLSIYLDVCLSVRPPACLICLSVCQIIRLSFYFPSPFLPHLHPSHTHMQKKTTHIYTVKQLKKIYFMYLNFNTKFIESNLT